MADPDRGAPPGPGALVDWASLVEEAEEPEALGEPEASGGAGSAGSSEPSPVAGPSAAAGPSAVPGASALTGASVLAAPPAAGSAGLTVVAPAAAVRRRVLMWSGVSALSAVLSVLSTAEATRLTGTGPQITALTLAAVFLALCLVAAGWAVRHARTTPVLQFDAGGVEVHDPAEPPPLAWSDVAAVATWFADAAAPYRSAPTVIAFLPTAADMRLELPEPGAEQLAEWLAGTSVAPTLRWSVRLPAGIDTDAVVALACEHAEAPHLDFRDETR